MLNKDTISGTIGTAISALGTGIQTNDILQKISLIITIIGGIITLISALSNWWKDAKKDGKITKDEVKDAVKIIKDSTKDIIIKKEDKEDK